MKIMITGANGFIGKSLCGSLPQYLDSPELMAVVRNATSTTEVSVGNIDSDTNWKPLLAGVDAVVHAAAQASVSNTRPESIWQTNVLGTLNLAQQAAKAGVKRFVFLSSVKVHGESSKTGEPFTEGSPKRPEDLYAQSKLAAEEGLLSLAQDSKMDVVILRLPLVYGPGVKGNFCLMMDWVKKRVPLPLGMLGNQRSLLSVGNLVDVVGLCLNHPDAANEAFLVADGYDLSTTELLKMLGVACDKSPRLLPVPASLLNLTGVMLGKGEMVRRLTGNLQLDISKARQQLGWRPPLTLTQSFKALSQKVDT